MEKDNVEQFIQLYNIFDDLLREKFNQFNRSFSMIQRYIDKLESSSYFHNRVKARKIDMIRVLRNNLVHEFDMNSSKLIIITDETLQFLKNEIEELKNPITAFQIMTRVENLYALDLHSDIKTGLKNMLNKGFSQIPVLENGYLIGVFSPNVLFKFLAINNNNYDLNTLKIRDFKKYIPINLHISEQYAFVSRDADIEDLYQIYDKYNKQGKKLVAIFVSENGKQDEKLLGMIVLNDLIRFSK